jgi:predicted GH43/DUF377 family glycosyl hydrolase
MLGLGNNHADPPVRVRRLPIRLTSEDNRIIARPIPFGTPERVRTLVDRLGALSEPEIEEALSDVVANFDSRHEDIRKVFGENYQQAAENGITLPTEPRRLLLGAYLTMEYAIQSAALFNPSIVPHFDQSNLPGGALRFIMSLRATGEGHVSSIVFLTGLIEGPRRIKLDAPAPFAARARLAPDQSYLKHLFRRKLGEMQVNMEVADLVLQELPDRYTCAQLEDAIDQARKAETTPGQYEAVFETMLWLARANYQLQLPPEADVSDLIIFPQNDNENRGVEDLRLVRFTEKDGTATYYGTYTAYNGRRTLPMLLETSDFRRIQVHTLNGKCVRDKGMALFPRRVGGHYVMCSRIDGQNLYISWSDHIHFWESATLLAKPRYPWELMLIGNCGSPVETPEGWLLITHGVGPMRRYCIGAMLLDLKDPSRLVARLPEPILEPAEHEREGYVPNVVYSCGSLVHDGVLYLPYAMSDRASSLATIELDDLLQRLRQARV